MAVSYDVGADGVLTCGLEVSNVERQPESGPVSIVKTIKTVKQ
jgi:hypothetical protein